MYSVYQHWDPLKVCMVGRSYPPEFYSWVKNTRIRKLFEKIAVETAEDYSGLIKLLETFGVEVLRPKLPDISFVDGKFIKPPMAPRDYTGMIGNTFYYTSQLIQSQKQQFESNYNNIKDPSWPECKNFKEFGLLPEWIQQECLVQFELKKGLMPKLVKPYSEGCYDHIYDHIAAQGNTIKRNTFKNIRNDVLNTAMIIPVGKDLIVGTTCLNQNQTQLLNLLNNEFKNTRNHVVNSGGHLDGSIVPICPGLVLSSVDVDLENILPGWDTLFIRQPSVSKHKKFKELTRKNSGRWWIPGQENNQELINFIEIYFRDWLGFVEETVFDLNLLIIDPNNIVVANALDQTLEKKIKSHNINIHVIPFRHRYFWDGGIHCMTSDLHREGTQQDYFPQKD